MAAAPDKYYTATETPGNVFTDAALPDGTDAGLSDGENYVIQNLSTARVYFEERAADGPAGDGRWVEGGEWFNYHNANQDSPLFAWVIGRTEAKLSISVV